MGREQDMAKNGINKKLKKNNIQFPLTNDIMFGLVMQDAELCRQMLQRILPEKKIHRLRLCKGSNVELQKTIQTGVLSKSVRLDVLFEGEDTWYDIEMQTRGKKELPMRGRYYGAAMDVDQIRKGTPYWDMKPSYVIFICTFDYYGQEQAVYQFQNFDVKNSLLYGDCSYKIVVNTRSPKRNTPPELVPFFDYMNSMKVPKNDDFIQKLHERVEQFNRSEWRRKMMTLGEQMEMDRRDAFKEGEQLGLEKGRAEGEARRNREIAKKFKDSGIDLWVIAKNTELSLEEVEKL